MALPAILVAITAALPLVYLVQRASERGWDGIVAVIWRARTQELVVTSLVVMAGVAALSLVLGLATAALVARLALPWRRLWPIVVALPLAMPSYVAAFALTSTVSGARGTLLTIVVIAGTTYPYVTLPALAALARADHAQADVARTLGRGPVRAFCTVTLPQIFPSAVAGALLCALYALSDFATPAMLRTPTLTVGIFRLFQGTINRTSPAALALLLIVIAFAVMAIEQAVRRARGGRDEVVLRRVPPASAGPWTTAAAIAVILTPVILAVVVPVTVLSIRLMGGSRYSISGSDLGNAALTTLMVGGAAALISVVLGLPVATLAARYRGRWIDATEALSLVGQALPGIVIALALVFLSLRLTPWAYQSAGVLIAAYVILFLSKTVGASRAAIAQVPRALEEVSHTLGRGRLRSWAAVTLTGALPGIASGALLAMAATMKEVPATLLLRPTGMDTLATELWTKTSINAYGAATPAALALVLVACVPAWMLSRTVRP